MALPDVIINRSGGITRRQETGDGISGILWVSSGWPGRDPVAFYSIEELRKFVTTVIGEDFPTYCPDLAQYLSDFWTMSPGQKVWVHCYNVDEGNASVRATAFVAELKRFIDFAEGEIKQMAITDPSNTSMFSLSEINTYFSAIAEVAQWAESNHLPLYFVTTFAGTKSEISGLNLRDGFTIPNLSFVSGVSYDGDGNGFSAIGALLGTIAKAPVNASVAWTNYRLPITMKKAEVVGDNSFKSLTTSERNTLNDHGVIFPRTHVGLAGVYWNDSHSCNVATDTFANIETMRVWNKASRIVRSVLLTSLSGPVLFNADGTLEANYVTGLEGAVRDDLTTEIVLTKQCSAIQVVIDPTQDVVSTSRVDVALEIVSTGTARNINTTISIVAKLSSI